MQRWLPVSKHLKSKILPCASCFTFTRNYPKTILPAQTLAHWRSFSESKFSAELISRGISPNAESKDDIIMKQLARRLASDTKLADKFVQNLSHESKLHIANEILSSKMNGKEYTGFIAGRHRRVIAVREVSMSLPDDLKSQIDKNGDGLVSQSELEEWLENFAKVSEQSQIKMEKLNENKKPSTPNTSENSHAEPLTPIQIRRLLLITGIPFIGFGFLDNGVMIVAGDLIEDYFGVLLGLSTLAAAGLGNLLSDIVGLAFGSWVEKGARKLGIKDPKLSLKQLSTPATKYYQLGASTVGITIGCLLGMLPLLFM